MSSYLSGSLFCGEKKVDKKLFLRIITHNISNTKMDYKERKEIKYKLICFIQ